MTEFAVPAKIAGKFPNDYEGALVAIAVEAYDPASETTRGEAPMVEATVTICSGLLTGTKVDARIFNKNLVAQTKDNVGSIVLGRLAKVPAGGFMSWQLADPSPEDVAAAAVVFGN